MTNKIKQISACDQKQTASSGAGYKNVNAEISLSPQRTTMSLIDRLLTVIEDHNGYFIQLNNRMDSIESAVGLPLTKTKITEIPPYLSIVGRKEENEALDGDLVTRSGSHRSKAKKS